MVRLYGHRWTSSYGEADDGTWLRILGDLDPVQIGQGIAQAGQQFLDWPPTLPQFRRLCLGQTMDKVCRTYLGSQATEAQRAASRALLPAPEQSHKTPAEHIQAMRDRLKSST